jgi:hypothetical protein
MTRSELAVTIAGLIATFCLPWPQSEETHARRQFAAATHSIAARASARLGAYETFGRVRTGPTDGIQPTR